MSTPNKAYKTTCGKTFWHSRSVACAATIFFTKIEEKFPHCLIVKRGPESELEPGKFCLPCWYLDWDESSSEGTQRETSEETSEEAGIYRKVREIPCKIEAS